MLTSTFKRRLAKAAVASAVAALGVASVMAGSGTADADPKQDDAPLITMGSDTTQDILDAFAGEVNGKLYTPLRSSSTLSGAGVQTGRKQIASWRAVNLDASGNPEQCVEPAGGINVDRPNGSGQGRRALTAAFNGVGFGVPAVTCTSTFDNFAGLIHFSRSSSGSSATTGNLTYVPFARDALQWVYSAPSVPLAVSDLTTAEVQGLHTNSGGSAVLTKGGTRIIACRIQDGSGTYTSWGSNMGLNVPTNATDKTTLETSTSECRNAFDSVQIGINGVQEHDPVGIKDVCDRIRAGYTPAGGGSPVAAQPNTQCIIGYSVANWVAQFNDRGTRNLPVTPTAATGGVFNVGTRDLGVAGYVINGPADAAPNTTYFNGSFGRDVYNVIPTSILTLPGNTALKTMLLAGFDSEGPGSGPAMCGTVAVATRTLMGFGAPVGQPCGATGAFLKGNYDFSNTGTIGAGGA
jgi:ABC-type phosphate transport system substrate-binding protein